MKTYRVIGRSFKMLSTTSKPNKNGPKTATWTRLLKSTQRAIIPAVLFMGVGINIAYADETDQSGLETVYHVYSSGKYVGSLSDEEKLDQLKESTVEKVASQYSDFTLSADADLSIIPERVFTSLTDDEVVLEKLQPMLTVEAEAIEVVIDEKTAFYVKDLNVFKEVMRRLKLQSVSEQQLAALETRNPSTQPLPPLKEGETRLVDIIISGNMKAEPGKTTPNEVRSADEAMELLNKGTLEEKKYTIKAGDVLGKIAALHQMTTAQLIELNPGYTDNTVLQVGTELNVTILEPYVHVDASYETKRKEPIKHKSVTKENAEMYKGEKELTTAGSDGEKIVTELIRKHDGVIISRSVSNEDVIVEAKDEVTVVGTKVMPSRGSGEFIWPTNGGYVSSQRGERWGRVHEGIDIARPSSYAIKVADNGVVTDAGWHSTYGNRIVVTHNNGYDTLYAHLSAIDVHVGQVVPQGTAIGVMGSTGRSTGVHLHFEVLKNGVNINPMSVLK